MYFPSSYLVISDCEIILRSRSAASCVAFHAIELICPEPGSCGEFSQTSAGVLESLRDLRLCSLDGVSYTAIAE